MLNWVATSYLLGTGVCLLPIGRISDIYGRKRIFIIGLVSFTITTGLLSLTPDAVTLITLRFFQGVSCSMLAGPSMAIITSVFPPHERGRALGINIAAIYLGLSMGPLIGGMLTGYLGWRSIFFITAPVGAILVCLTIASLKGEWADARGEDLDYFGSIVYGLTLVALIYGLSIMPTPSGLWLVCGSAAGFVIFVKWEQKTKHPVLDINLFSTNRLFVLSNLAAMIHYCASFALIFLLSLYLQYIKGLSPEEAGFTMMVYPVLMTILTPSAGRLSDRVEPRLLVSGGMSLTSLGIFGLIFLNEDTSLAAVVGILVVMGIGYALFSSPNSNAVMSSVEKRYYGVASGVLSTMRLSGQMISMATVLLLFSLYIGDEPIAVHTYPAFMKSMHTTFIIFSLLCVIGVFISLCRGEIHRDNRAVELPEEMH
ncbi:MAG: MFS transporter [Deltaproteobacteria bacterium]|nr:MFS transporter [Deltaproteobacteria bacterium]